ncbi:MAG: rod shape-determining protein MreC [Acidobacteriota bacterium]
MDERRTAWLLAFILGGQLLMMAIQAPTSGRGDNFFEGLVLQIVAPVPRAVSAVSARAARFIEALRRQSEIISRNRELRRRIEELEIERMTLRAAERRIQRLEEAGTYTPPPDFDLSAADVVFLDTFSGLNSLLIYIGQASVVVNQPVLTRDGLLGRVVQVAGPYAKVQMIDDQTAAVGAVVERTRRQGVVRSGADSLELDFVPLQADVLAGDRVLTSGFDGVYPRGIPIGVVSEVAKGDDLFYRIAVEWAVDTDRLDHVYLLGPKRLPTVLMDDSGSETQDALAVPAP